LRQCGRHAASGGKQNQCKYDFKRCTTRFGGGFGALGNDYPGILSLAPNDIMDLIHINSSTRYFLYYPELPQV
jgi:hypothetical protein